MRLENRVPKTYVISESKINEDTLKSALSDFGFSKYEQEWKEKNKGVRVSDNEKLPETLVKLITKGSHNLTNQEVNLGLVANESVFLKHSIITVMFKDISLNVSTNISSDNIKNYEILKSNIDKDKISFWVPGFIEKSKAAMIDYGLAFDDITKRIKNIIDEFEKINTNQEEMQHLSNLLVQLYPQAIQIDAVMSCSLYEWRDIILRFSQPYRLDEERYIFLYLLRDFKRRYPSSFQDIVIENISSNEVFGVDTLDSDNSIWKNFRAVKKRT